MIWRMGVSKGRKEIGRVEGKMRTKRRGTEGKKRLNSGSHSMPT